MFADKMGFRPVKRYAKLEGCEDILIRRLKYGKNFIFDIRVFVDIMITEYVLREIVQREHALKIKARVSEKIATDKHEEARYDEQLRDLSQEYTKAEWEFYLAESMLPIGPVKRSYDILRQSPAWYLREELVEDCARRGGCCGRNCGCCKTRQSATKRIKGIGHCTLSCQCCSNERGFKYTTHQRQQMVLDLENHFYDHNPAYVIKMADSYFLKSQGVMLRRWKRMLGIF